MRKLFAISGLLFLSALTICLAEAGLGAKEPNLPVSQGNPAAASPAWTDGETLHFKLLWPSSLSLGEATLTVSPANDQMRFELRVDAALPTHDFSASISSLATRQNLCSLQYEQKVIEGVKTSNETIQFDQNAHQAHRTRAGQTDTFPTPPCARDPLAFFYYFRAQIAAGAPLNAQSFFMGPSQAVDLRRSGNDSVSAGGKQYSTERYEMTYRNPKTAKTFQVWMSTDARRAPVRIQLPFPLAIFSAELQ